MIRLLLALILGATLGAGVGWLVWGPPADWRDLTDALDTLTEAQPR